MSRPTVHTAKPADAYAAPNEKIVEFFDKDAQRGGLISIIRRDDGTLNVGVYNLDDGVSVSCPVIADLLAACKAAMPLIALADEAGCFKDCALPRVGTRTLAMLERLVAKTEGK